VLSSSCAIQVEGNEGRYVHIIHGVYDMNEEERDTFRFDLALCLLVGIVIAFCLINIIFK
jgi:hypothetical protein